MAASLEERLAAAERELQEWRDAFREEASSAPMKPSEAAAEHARLKKLTEELKKREGVLVLRLTSKEQELHELSTNIAELSQAINPNAQHFRTNFLDPILNAQFLKTRDEVKGLEKKLRQAQEDLEAVQFTPHSIMGKKLMAKCRLLQEENDEFGNKLAEGRIHKLEAELALQKEYCEELKKALNESNEWVLQSDEEIQNLQSTIVSLSRKQSEFKMMD